MVTEAERVGGGKASQHASRRGATVKKQGGEDPLAVLTDRLDRQDAAIEQIASTQAQMVRLFQIAQGAGASEGQSPPGGSGGKGKKSSVTMIHPTEVFGNAVNPPSGSDGQFGVFTPDQAKDLEKYGDQIKNILGWNVMTQMYVKAMQMGLDTFLMGQKFGYEVPMTFLQFAQTLAQMFDAYAKKMTQDWEKQHAEHRQAQNRVDEALVKSHGPSS